MTVTVTAMAALAKEAPQLPAPFAVTNVLQLSTRKGKVAPIEAQ
jgi:hypothetical protein